MSATITPVLAGERDTVAAAVLQEAMSKVGKALKASTSRPALKQLELLRDLDLEEDARAAEQEMIELIQAAKDMAEGEAGDSPKYEKAAAKERNRWELFLVSAVVLDPDHD